MPASGKGDLLEGLFKCPSIDLSRPLDNLVRLKPEGDFEARRIGRIRRMGEIPTHFEPKIMPDGPCGGLRGTRRSHGLSNGENRVWPFPDRRHDGRRSDVVDQSGIERLSAVHGVVLLGQGPLHAGELRSHEAEPATFKSLDDLAGQATLDTIGFHQYERSLKPALQKRTRVIPEQPCLVAGK